MITHTCLILILQNACCFFHLTLYRPGVGGEQKKQSHGKLTKLVGFNFVHINTLEEDFFATGNWYILLRMSKNCLNLTSPISGLTFNSCVLRDCKKKKTPK